MRETKVSAKGNGTEEEIRKVVENWANSVREKDFEGILRNHSAEILMFDVPPPLYSKGIAAYQGSWDLFFAASPDAPVFDICQLDITAGEDVAFVAALMRCVVLERGKEPSDLDFRLTIGLRKVNGHWLVTHEHHSIPA